MISEGSRKVYTVAYHSQPTPQSIKHHRALPSYRLSSPPLCLSSSSLPALSLLRGQRAVLYLVWAAQLDATDHGISRLCRANSLTSRRVLSNCFTALSYSGIATSNRMFPWHWVTAMRFVILPKVQRGAAGDLARRRHHRQLLRHFDTLHPPHPDIMLFHYYSSITSSERFRAWLSGTGVISRKRRGPHQLPSI